MHLDPDARVGSYSLGLCTSQGKVAGPGCVKWGGVYSHGIGIKQPGQRMLTPHQTQARLRRWPRYLPMASCKGS